MFADKIIYQIPAEIPPEEAAELYVEAGWMNVADTEAVRTMLKGTFAVSAAFYEGHLIGFMRALSDGVSDAYLLDLVVRREYRKLGVGRKILKHLADHLKNLGVDWIICIGAPGTEAFYARTDVRVMEHYTPFRYH